MLDPQVKKQLISKLGDPMWRLENLYYIRDSAGDKVLFQPNDEQKELLKNFWWFNVIPKARQLGITTFFCIFYLDCILFSENKIAGIIAHTREHAKKIFKDKIKFAWDNMPDWVKTEIGEPSTDTTQEMTFPNGSTIFVSTSARSGTVQYLHISEFGFTCQHYPDKAEEIVTGSINTVHSGKGMVSIESTAEGKGGYFYDFCMDALKSQQEGRTLSPLEFKLFFFPWWGHPNYKDEGQAAITKEYQDYFEDLKVRHKIELTDAQKRWYIIKHRTNKEKMYKEYPSTMEEAFNATIQGAYYASEMAKVYSGRRITRVPHDSSLPVDTWWDLGMNDMNVIIFTQSVGSEIRIIDCYANHGEGLAHYVKVLKERGYVYGSHTLPHDGDVRELGTGVTRKDTLTSLGLSDVRIGKKARIEDGIEKVRTLFSRFYFDEEKTDKLVSSLAAYRKEWDPTLGVFKDKPRHDENSHFADAMRTLGVEWQDYYEANTWDSSVGPKEQSFFAL